MTVVTAVTTVTTVRGQTELVTFVTCPNTSLPEMNRFASLLLIITLPACMTQQAYDGPKLPRDAVAHISGDLRFTAGSPVSVILRQVDERALSISQSGVDVSPGSHRLLVDCLVRETSETSRFSLDVEVAAGGKYRLFAETGEAREGCVAVHLEAVE